MRASWAALSIVACVAWAQTALAPPEVGFMRDSSDSLRPVHGIAGNFLLGDPVAAGVVSAGYSGSFGLIKSGPAVMVMDRTGSIIASSEAPDGPAQFAFSRTGEPAWAYLSTGGTLLAWDAGAFAPVPFDAVALGGPVIAIAAADSEHAALIVQRDDGLWDVRVQRATGEIDRQSAIGGVTAPVLMLASGDLVYAETDGLVVRKPDASERHIAAALPASFAFQQMGDEWIQVRDLTGDAQLAIRITENREQVYQLPEVSQ